MYVHSFQSMGTLDGPGIRFVVFTQGCPLRCIYCQNPDTWQTNVGENLSVEEIFEKVKRYKDYFSNGGGLTVSGGEPMLQQEEVKQLFTLCKKAGIHTAIDTSGVFLDTCDLFSVTDLCLLDIKMTNNADYEKYIGMSIEKTYAILNQLEEKNVDTWIRHVVIEGINDTEEDILELKKIINGKNFIKKIELLPYSNMCLEKYDGMEFALRDYPATSKDTIKRLDKILQK